MNPLRRILQSTALAGLLALGATAVAQTQSYVQKTKTVKAAVLLLDADHQGGVTPLAGGGAYRYGQTAAPFAFYNLDQATTIKPAGWTFVNPYAPGAVTTDIQNRYIEVYGSSTNANVPALGNRIGKRQGAYWTVRLSQLSETQISDYDVLLVAPKYLLQLTSLERERLRRFVDGGGVLWVDLLGAGYNFGVDSLNNLPYALQATPNFFGSLPFRDPASPVLSGPKQVSDADLNYLNPTNFLKDLAISPVAMPAATPTNNGSNFTSLVAEYARYRNVASLTTTGSTPQTLPLIAEARLGDGTVVVTARGAAEMLNQGSATQYLADLPGNSNIGYQAQDRNPQMNAQEAAAARLAINIASLGGNYRQSHGGNHNTSSATAEPGSPVLTRFAAESVTVAGETSSGAPAGAVTYKGFLVTTIGNRILVYDAVPGRDLDGDGDPDDGIVDSTGTVQNSYRDSSIGKSYDLVWMSKDLNSALSAPVCADVPEAANVAGNSADQILVTDASGTLYAYPLVRYAGYQIQGGVYDNNTQLYKLTPPTGAASGGHAYAPTVYDGLAYMADGVGGNRGRVWVADLSKGSYLGGTAAPWSVDGQIVSRPLPLFTASPTIGYIPAADSPGGADRVLYAPGIVNANVANAIPQPGFVSLWLGAKGETPASITFTPAAGPGSATMSLTTHAGATSNLPIYWPVSGDSASLQQLAPHVTLLKNGVALASSDPAYFITGGPTDGGPGIINCQVSSTMTSDMLASQNYQIRIDYTIDWYKALSSGGTVERGRLLLPIYKGNGGGSKTISGPIALTAHGTLHMIEWSDPTRWTDSQAASDSADSYFAIREDAGVRGQFRVVSRYTLYKAYQQSFGGLAGTPVPAVLGDVDAVQNFLPPALQSSTFTNFRFAGGVSLRNGVAFATINAQRGLIPVTMLAAFRAEPETAELRLGTEVTSVAGAGFRVQQADWARSKPNTVIQGPIQSNLAASQVVVDTDNGVVRIENLATVTNNEITDCISESQPIGFSSGTAGAFTYRQPDAFGDRWSPLLWFGLWNGGTATGTPLVAGNSVFIPASTSLPSLLTTGTFSYSGVLWSVDADSPTTGEYAVPLPDRPWIVQQVQLTGTPGPDFASPYFRMPQNRGVMSPEDFKLRLLQTKLGTATNAGGGIPVAVAGGDGVVAAWTPYGMYGLSRADFTICDEGRLLRVDSAGNPIGNVFGGKFSGIGNGGSASELRPLVRPVKAYPVGSNQTLVVDAGSNRIMRLDEDGTVLRSIDRILLDPNHRPAAYQTNEPLTFNDPRDVATYEGYVNKGTTEVVTAQHKVEYWIRHIVADSGNHRIVELADRFEVNSQGVVGPPITRYPKADGTPDPNGALIQTPDPETGLVTAGVPIAQVGVLTWQSPSLEQTGKVGDYYNSISRIYVGSALDGSGRYVYVTGVSRTRPTPSSAGLDNPGADTTKPSGGGGGAVVVFDPLGGTRVFNQFSIPDLTNVPFYVPGNGTPTVGTFATSADRVAQNGRPFSGLQAVTASTVVSGNYAAARIMVTDADAVYEFVLDSPTLASTTGTPTLAPVWMINQAAFTALRGTISGSTYTLGSNPLLFRPSYARRLESGDVLIANGYRGLMRDGVTAYSGEVTLLDGSPGGNASSNTGFTTSGFYNLGFNSGSVRFELPPLTGIRGLISPVFADRR